MNNHEIAIHQEVQIIKCKAAQEINAVLERAFTSASIDPAGTDAHFMRDEIFALVTSEDPGATINPRK